MAEILSTISVISFVAAGVLFVVSVIFWIKYKIPSVIGDLSGRTARKSIEQMRQNHEKTEKIEKNRRRFKSAVEKSGKNSRPETGLLKNKETEILKATVTEPLAEAEATELLADEAATELLADTDKIELLNHKKEKVWLEEKKETEKRGCEGFVLLEEIIFIHTQETMEWN